MRHAPRATTTACWLVHGIGIAARAYGVVGAMGLLASWGCWRHGDGAMGMVVAGYGHYDGVTGGVGGRGSVPSGALGACGAPVAGVAKCPRPPPRPGGDGKGVRRNGAGICGWVGRPRMARVAHGCRHSAAAALRRRRLGSATHCMVAAARRQCAGWFRGSPSCHEP